MKISVVFYPGECSKDMSSCTTLPPVVIPFMTKFPHLLRQSIIYSNSCNHCTVLNCESNIVFLQLGSLQMMTLQLVLGQEDPLQKEIATHSCILAWRILWTEEPGRLQFMGLQRVGCD